MLKSNQRTVYLLLALKGRGRVRVCPPPYREVGRGSLLLCQLLAFVIKEYEQAVVKTYTFVDLDADEIAFLG